MLTQDQVDQFWNEGYTVARAVVRPDDLAALRGQLDRWIEESRGQVANYGETIDGKKRFDLEAGHGAQTPKLRRVANPADISEAYRSYLFESLLVDMVAQLLGPDIKFHHCKINNKLPGMQTKVDWHQDHAYDPHTNDDMLASVTLLDDMTEDNGCVLVVPGSHREPHRSHYQERRFTGATAPELEAEFTRRAVAVTGQAGDVLFMHTWCLHASGENRSAAPRRLLICDYTAADAFPLTPPIVPSPLSGTVVRGVPSRYARLKADTIELPPAYEEDSFFTVQQQKKAS